MQQFSSLLSWKIVASGCWFIWTVRWYTDLQTLNRKMVIMTVWTCNSIVTIFIFVDMANCPLKSGLSGFSGWNCSPSHANALHPASVRIGKFKFIGKETQRACKESGKLLHHDDRWNQSYRLEKPCRNKSVLDIPRAVTLHALGSSPV